MNDDELDQWHRALARELEARVRNRMFFVHVDAATAREEGAATTSPADVVPEAWDNVAQDVEEWLGDLDPDSIDADDPPTFQARPGDVPIELAAVPKKARRRGTDPLIVNPYPTVNSFRGSYSAGPAPDFDDGA